jgi:hypothetical protein
MYGNVIVIFMPLVAPGNRNRCAVLHFGGIVSGAGRFVDAACRYSDVDSHRFVFRTGTWERCVNVEVEVKSGCVELTIALES